MPIERLAFGELTCRPMSIIPEDGLCIGSGGAPSSRGTHSEGDGRTTGRCPVCSGRFRLDDGLLADHRTTPVAQREDPNAY
jgi:hypothetical protein